MSNEQKQQKLREWILTQEYFFLNAKYDGMTAWEIAGKILKVIEEPIKVIDLNSTVEELTLSEELGMPIKVAKK